MRGKPGLTLPELPLPPSPVVVCECVCRRVLKPAAPFLLPPLRRLVCVEDRVVYINGTSAAKMTVASLTAEAAR